MEKSNRKKYDELFHHTVVEQMGSHETNMLYLGDIAPFLNENEDIGAAIRPKLLGMLTNSQTNAYLRIELAAVVDHSSKRAIS